MLMTGKDSRLGHGGAELKRTSLITFALVIAAALAVVLGGLGMAMMASGCGGAASTTTTTTTSTTLNTTTSTTAAPPSTIAADIAGATFTAQLSGVNEVPAVDTAALGTVTFTVDSTGTKMAYVLKVTALSNVTVARLRNAVAGATGDIVATLFPGPKKKGSFTGTLATGTLKASSLTGPLKGKTIGDLVTLMKNLEIYVNVGSTAHSNGEIRGQVQ